MAGKIIPLFPSHKNYVEPFGGSAAVLLAKKLCDGVETYNDVDGGLADFFKVLADQGMFLRFCRKVGVLPYSRKLYMECAETWQRKRNMEERVWRWFVLARQSFGGVFGTNWGYSIKNRSEALVWRNAVDRLAMVHERLLGVQIECRGFLEILKPSEDRDYLAICDPLYVFWPCKGLRKYRMDFCKRETKK